MNEGKRHEQTWSEVTLSSHKIFAGIGDGGMITVVSILMSYIIPLRQGGASQGVIYIIYASDDGCRAPPGRV